VSFKPPTICERSARYDVELGSPAFFYRHEIQTGCGRTGNPWVSVRAARHVPDVILAPKASGGIGMPIAVRLLRQETRHVGAGCAHRKRSAGQPALAAGVASSQESSAGRSSRTCPSRASTRPPAPRGSSRDTTRRRRPRARADAPGSRSSIDTGSRTGECAHDPAGSTRGA